MSKLSKCLVGVSVVGCVAGVVGLLIHKVRRDTYTDDMFDDDIVCDDESFDEDDFTRGAPLFREEDDT